MTENKRFTSWGNRIKRNGTLLNIEFKTKSDAKLCCKLLNQMDKEQKEYIDKLDEIFKWHKEHYGKSILDERLEFKSDCEKENEQLKSELSEKDIQLDFLKSENNHMSDLVNENGQLKESNERFSKTVAEQIIMIKEYREENEQLKKELFEARKDYLIETADISDKLHLEEWIEKERKEIFK